jgi:hypothetical protein
METSSGKKGQSRCNKNEKIKKRRAIMYLEFFKAKRAGVQLSIYVHEILKNLLLLTERWKGTICTLIAYANEIVEQ